MCMSEQWEGVWRGSYYYDAPEQPETPPAPFDLRIEEVMPDGSIRGEIVDMPDDTPPGPRASLVGRIDGDQVRFTKDYGQGQVADENGRLVGLRDLYRRHGIRMLDRRGGVIEYQGQLFEHLGETGEEGRRLSADLGGEPVALAHELGRMALVR